MEYRFPMKWKPSFTITPNIQQKWSLGTVDLRGNRKEEVSEKKSGLKRRVVSDLGGLSPRVQLCLSALATRYGLCQTDPSKQTAYMYTTKQLLADSNFTTAEETIWYLWFHVYTIFTSKHHTNDISNIFVHITAAYLAQTPRDLPLHQGWRSSAWWCRHG